MTKPLGEFAKEILEDGIIDAEEVKKIRERIYADNVIDKEEADFLFELNDAVSGKENDPSWKDLFVEALSDYVLKDEVSPGEVDDDEAK
jgi:TPP-dependent pyruvate/acetoin dehydrogenase alpha subunit